MQIAFDGRVLKHNVHSGVENYTAHILDALKEKVEVRLFKPKVFNKYLQQIWEHSKLPCLLSKNELLFCPANIAPLWVSPKNKLVITLHDVAFKTFPKSVSRVFYLYYTWVVPRNIKRADMIITISEASKREILHFYPDAGTKIAIIPLGIDKKYQILPEIQKKKQILYVGSVNERKNLSGTIKAFEKLPKHLEYNLVVVGNFFDNFSISNELKEVLSDAKSNTNIIFKHGLNKEELIYEYNISTCLLFPSFYEGFGLPPLEAMACGTPVIVSSLSSMPEVCGDAAIYVDPYNIEDINKKVQMLLEDKTLQQKMIQKGLERSAQFTWEKAVQEHIKIFEEALEKENH